MTLDRKRLAGIADCEIVAVAVSLPWSTSATSILLAVWLLTVIPTFDFTMLRRELRTAAGGLPVALWLLAAVGMLWASVSWSERLAGLDGFHRLLVIPLLLAQFRRSGKGMPVLYGFLVSASLLLIISWIFALEPSLAWHRDKPYPGVPVKDVISQSTIFLVCAFGLIWHVCEMLRERNWRMALWTAILAGLFLASLVFVAASRGDLMVLPLLVVLLGWRQFRWRGVIAACIAAGILAAASWESSPELRQRLAVIVQDIEIYQDTGANTDVGTHIEFLKKSITFVRQAPFIGHGTGSIAELFRQAAVGKTGAAGLASVNPHSQIFAVAIQLGLLGTAILLAMWFAHYHLFRAAGFVAWAGAVVVVENVVSSLSSSHLFDFTHGWLYVIGVGVAGGMVLHSMGPARVE
jgi:O-antigen ligase